MRIYRALSCVIILGSFLLCTDRLDVQAEPVPSATPGAWDTAQPKRVLFFTKSAGFEHSVVKRAAPDQLSHSETILSALGKKHHFDVTCSKDGEIFTPENIDRYDAIVFFTIPLLIGVNPWLKLSRLG